MKTITRTKMIELLGESVGSSLHGMCCQRSIPFRDERIGDTFRLSRAYKISSILKWMEKIPPKKGPTKAIWQRNKEIIREVLENE